MILTLALMISGAVTSVLFSLWYIWKFQHPEDKKRAWIPKIVIVIAVTLAFGTVFLLPVDVANRDWDVLPMAIIWMVAIFTDLIVLLLVIPFATVYYESLDAKPNIIKQVLKATLSAIVLFLVCAFVGLLSWFLLGETLLPVHTYSCDLVSHTSAGDPLSMTMSGASASTVTVSIKMFIHVHLMTMAALVGMALFIVFASIGVIAIPLDMINEWRFRPRAFSEERVLQFRIVFKRRSQTLRDIATRYTEEMEERDEDAISGHRRKLTRKERKLPGRIRRAATQLEKEYDYVQIVSGKKKYLPLVYWGKLLLGLALLSLATLWLVHMVVFTLPSPPLHPGLNLVFQVFESFAPFVGTGLWSLLAVYLMLSTVKGIVRAGTRLLLFANIHPLETHASYSNALLFNAGMLLLTAPAVVSYLTDSFSIYTRFTAAVTIFDTQIDHLAYVRHFFPWVYALMPVISGATLILMVIFPKRNDLVDRLLQQDLGKAMKKVTKGKKGDRFLDKLKDAPKLALGKLPGKLSAEDRV